MDSSHAHDMDVTSISIECAGALDMIKTERWLGGLLDARGEDIMRMKGLLCCQTTTVTTSPIQSGANDGNDGNAGIYSRVENTEKDSGDDSGSSGVTSSSVTTVDVVGLQSVHMCYQGDVLRPLGADEEANSRIVFIGRNLPAWSYWRQNQVLRGGLGRWQPRVGVIKNQNIFYRNGASGSWKHVGGQAHVRQGLGRRQPRVRCQP